MTTNYKGFSLVELMAVLAIGAIILTAAIPSFQSMVVRNSIATQTNDFLLALTLARSEAMRRGTTVSVVASAGTAANEFGAGYCVATGTPSDCSGTLIRRFQGVSAPATLNSVEDVSILSFNSLGGLTGSATRSMDLCYGDATSEHAGRRILISLIGRAKSHAPDSPSTTNRPCSCANKSTLDGDEDGTAGYCS